MIGNYHKFLPQSFHLFCSRHLDILRGSVCISRSILPKADDMLLVLHWAACWYFPHIKFTVYSANVSSAEFVTYFPSTIITQWQKNPRCKSSWLGFIWQPIWILSVFWIITSIATTKNIKQFLKVQCRVFRNRTVYPLPYGTRVLSQRYQRLTLLWQWLNVPPILNTECTVVSSNFPHVYTA